jgi:hypothetical protein
MCIRDISSALGISIAPVLIVLKSTAYTIKAKRSHYDRLKTGELWTCVGKKKKKKKIGLIYAYRRESGTRKPPKN